jgi:hypothetical protein
MMSRFSRYLEKVFDVSGWAGRLSDSRERPRITTAAVWWSAFYLFATGRGSLNAMEADLRAPGRFDAWIGPRKPSADRIGDVMALMDPASLRAMLSGVNHRLGRNKALRALWPLRFVAFDGHEFFSLTASAL